MSPVSAFCDDALGHHDAVGLVQELHAGRVSPGELAEAAIARTEAVNPTLNGLAFPAYDRVLARARGARPFGGFFDGVPTFIKDNVAVAGMPTMRGTDAWHPRPDTADGDFARAYLATGLSPVGKTRLSEFGFSASCEHPRLGPVRNPWSPEHTAGASSSGSGAFVAAGVVPIAHANDGGGSIRIPASCNGLVGLKPSRGRLPQDQHLRMMPLRIVVDGVLTRSVRDTAAVYREMERVYRNPKLAPIGDVTGPGVRRLRIAVCTESIARQAGPEISELTHQTAAVLDRLGHRVSVIGNPVPAGFKDDFVTYWAFLAFATVRSGRQSFGPTFDRSRLDNLTCGLDRVAARNLHRVPAAIARLARTRRVTERLFRDFDVLLMPTLAEPTLTIGTLDPTAGYEQIIERLIDWVAFTPLQNVTGEPAISLPLAQTSTGLPVGMMFSAPTGRESTLLELAYELEAAVGWPTLAG